MQGEKTFFCCLVCKSAGGFVAGSGIERSGFFIDMGGIFYRCSMRAGRRVAIYSKDFEDFFIDIAIAGC
jgi:hypothetical protein